jgi:hypothetical protein
MFFGWREHMHPRAELNFRSTYQIKVFCASLKKNVLLNRLSNSKHLVTQVPLDEESMLTCVMIYKWAHMSYIPWYVKPWAKHTRIQDIISGYHRQTFQSAHSRVYRSFRQIGRHSSVRLHFFSTKTHMNSVQHVCAKQIILLKLKTKVRVRKTKEEHGHIYYLEKKSYSDEERFRYFRWIPRIKSYSDEVQCMYAHKQVLFGLNYLRYMETLLLRDCNTRSYTSLWLCPMFLVCSYFSYYQK